jgi:hypothetical protein
MAITAAQVTQMQAALTLLGSLLPAATQPYVVDIATDGPVVFAAYTQILAAVAAVPASPTAVQVVEAFGIPAGTPAHSVAELADLIRAQSKTTTPKAA